jgi:hypothetical protein
VKATDELRWIKVRLDAIADKELGDLPTNESREALAHQVGRLADAVARLTEIIIRDAEEWARIAQVMPPRPREQMPLMTDDELAEWASAFQAALEERAS